MEQVGAIRATVGAQSVSLSQDASNDAIAIINQTASESSKRDANIGAVFAQYVQDKVRSAVGDAILRAVQSDARLLSQLVVDSIRRA